MAHFLRLSRPLRASAVQRHVQLHQRRGTALHWLLLDEEEDEDFDIFLPEGASPHTVIRTEDAAPDPVAGGPGLTSGLNQLRDRVVPEVCAQVDKLYNVLYHKRPKTKFMGSAFHTYQLPHVNNSFEIGIIGRSNVGKSSLINALQSQPDLANHSSTPGRTQCINLFQLGCTSAQSTLLSEGESRLQGLQKVLQTQTKRGQDALAAKTRKRLRKLKARRHQQQQAFGGADDDNFVIPGTDRSVPVLADLPGYGFAKPPVAVVRKWRALMHDYLSGRVQVPAAAAAEKPSGGDAAAGGSAATSSTAGGVSSAAARPMRQSNKLTVSLAKQNAYAGLYERLADFVRQQEQAEAAAAAQAAAATAAAVSPANSAARTHQRIIRRNNLRCLLVLLDARRGGLLAADHEWLQLMDRYGVPAQIVLTKVDKVSPQQLRELVSNLRRDLVVYGRICRPLIHAVSSHYKLGLEELRWSLCHIFVEAAMAANEAAEADKGAAEGEHDGYLDYDYEGEGYEDGGEEAAGSEWESFDPSWDEQQRQPR